MDIINIEESKVKLPTLKYRGVYLHSKYDPENEAVNFIEKKYKPANIQILIGYGLGYIYKELVNRKSSKEKIIVIDPLISKTCGNTQDLILLEEINAVALKKFFNKHISVIDTLNIIISINYDKVLKENLKLILTMLEEKVKSNEIVENTIQFFSSQWHENYIKNLKFAIRDNPVGKLFKKKFTCPIVIASGGPSLTKQIPLIKKYRDKFILIAAGTTINSLIKNDIRPDFVISVDGGEINHKHFENLHIEDFPLIYCPTVHYGIREKFKEGYYFLPLIESDLQFHYSRFSNNEIDIIMDGSSVANYAYNLALLMTTGPVAMIGQDLAYTSGLTHAEGNLNKKNIRDNSEFSRKLIEREGYFGEPVLTDNVFLQMRDIFEVVLQSFDANSRSYNCTEGGLKINSFNQITFVSFLKDFTNEPVQISKENIVSMSIQAQTLKKELAKDVSNIKELIKLFEKALNLLDNNNSEIEYEAHTINKLDEIDNQIQTLIKFTSLEFAFNLINLRLFKYFKIDESFDRAEKFKVSFDQNKYMYSEMLNVSKDSLKLIEKEIEYIK
ncbi:motility associated factor glycosyltransferase family protein [Lysinibacillus sp. NPDC094177]|uniref:motility associated factor glycosyltransferase family protein n=1 Tax=Lysinibacillus sp. NPDC094177 TaxID=3390580 RepID=UPI003D038DDC